MSAGRINLHRIRRLRGAVGERPGRGAARSGSGPVGERPRWHPVPLRSSSGPVSAPPGFRPGHGSAQVRPGSGCPGSATARAPSGSGSTPGRRGHQIWCGNVRWPDKSAPDPEIAGRGRGVARSGERPGRGAARSGSGPAGIRSRCGAVPVRLRPCPGFGRVPASAGSRPRPRPPAPAPAQAPGSGPAPNRPGHRIRCGNVRQPDNSAPNLVAGAYPGPHRVQDTSMAGDGGAIRAGSEQWAR